MTAIAIATNGEQMDIEQMIDRIEQEREAVGARRDKLDDLIGELEGLRGSCEEAWDCLRRARDALSELA